MGVKSMDEKAEATMMGVLIAIAIGVLVLAIVTQIGPVVGGEVEQSLPSLMETASMTLYNDTAVGLGVAPVGSVTVYNTSDYSTEVATAGYTVSESAGTITMNKVAPNYNGTYYVSYYASGFSSEVNSDVPAGADVWSDNMGLISVAALVIIAGVIIAVLKGVG